jgi:RNA polymerase sigma-70 factor (ECF subfamily)
MIPDADASLPPGVVERCVRAARQGSNSALGRLLEACRPFLLNVARGALDADLQAKGSGSDLVQETFLEAQQDFAQFTGTTEQELKAWLCRILLNNLANFTRRYRRTAKRAVKRELSLDRDGTDLRPQLEQDGPSPSDEALRNEQRQALEQAVARLPAREREAIEYRHRDDCTFEELGRRLGCSTTVARELWLRAVKQLRQELRPPHDSGEQPYGA